MSAQMRRFLSAAVCCASGAAVALSVAGTAMADPLDPAPPPAPAPVLPGDPLAPLDAAEVPAPAADVTNQATAQVLPTPPDGVPHLASPDALPPGSTMDPTVMGNEGPNTSYLKDLWHAVQNQEISGKEALIMGFAQRGMNTPYPNQAPGPNVPTSGTDPALAAAAPPPAPLPAAAPLPGPAPVPAPVPEPVVIPPLPTP
jgi:resuscitation-promoting factor RpfA